MQCPRFRSSLFGKMFLRIGLAAFVPLVAVILIATVNAYRSVSEESFNLVEEEGRHYADLIGTEIKCRLNVLEGAATVLGGYRALPAQERGQSISDSIRRLLEQNPGIVCAWTMWEPGVVADAAHATEAGSTRHAQAFYASWVRINGTIFSARMDPKEWHEPYYTVPKDRMGPVLVDPYYYTYRENHISRSIFVSTLSVPIIEGGAFRGVVGFDSDADFYGSILSSFRVFKSGYALLIGSNAKLIWHPTAALLGTQLGSDQPESRQRWLREQVTTGRPFSYDKASYVSGLWSREFFFPVGTGIRQAPWYFSTVVPFVEIRERADRLALILSVIGAAALLSVWMAIYLTSRSISAPVAALSAGAERIAAGDLDGTVRVPGRDEVARLAESFNRMTGRLRETLDNYAASNRELAGKNEELARARSQLETLNAGLEERVAERTNALSEANGRLTAANGELEQAIRDLKAAQAQVVESEKMALLGRLTANIAHELNTPLGAIRSSVELIRETAPSFYDTFPEFIGSLPPVEREYFNALVRAGIARADDLVDHPDRARRRVLVGKLQETGMAVPELVADDVESLGAFEREAEVLSLVRRGRADVIAMAARIASLFRADVIIRVATDKAARTVAALAEYSRQDETESLQAVEPVKELETLLVLYYNTTKRGVTIERRYDCLDPVWAYRERLNQVWVNLINNALQAMDYRGTLELETRREGDWVRVSVTDSGPGIDEARKPYIFKPFFTTKKPGQGTGLGLDICRKIVEHHGGKISFESRPGRTTFSVLLMPAAGPQPKGNT